MTRKDAICLHRRCWADMQKELGDSPAFGERIAFRDRWNKKMFPGKKLERGTILCDYTYRQRREGLPVLPYKLGTGREARQFLF